MNSYDLLKKWALLIKDDKVIIKAALWEGKPNKELTAAFIVSGVDTERYIEDLLKRTNKHLEYPNQISPYNPAHGFYGDCCGIFNAFNEDDILICNECGMTITDLLEDMQSQIDEIKFGKQDKRTNMEKAIDEIKIVEEEGEIK